MVVSVLDKGSVELLEMMGHDFSPVESARVSYGKEKYESEDRNIKLLDYLYKHEHFSTLESVVFKFRVKAPIFVFRHWFRHRMSSFNERSGRYSKFDEGEFYVPEIMRVQDTVNKQGSIEDKEHYLDYYTRQINEHSQVSYELYQEMLRSGVAKEMARIVLPVNFYSEMEWTVNLRSLFNFLKQRLDFHAQYETRCYAEAVYGIVKLHLPFNIELFDKYIRIK